LLVITDDIALPAGKIRIRTGGSSGGHNGLKDIELHLGTKDFPRLRFGVGNDFPSGRQADYVLSTFSESELAEVNLSVPKSVEAIETFIEQDINKAMTLYN
jgi:PTH1 family peptidyl-tRNA hydrolase